MIIDFKSVAEIPFDPQTNGVKVLRSIIYDKGTCCAKPDDASKMVIVGEWRRQFSLTLVHFAESTAREPELLLYFVDYGFCKGDLEGVSVETLPRSCLLRGPCDTKAAENAAQDVHKHCVALFEMSVSSFFHHFLHFSLKPILFSWFFLILLNL